LIEEERIFIPSVPILLLLKTKCVRDVILSNDFAKPTVVLGVMLFAARLRNSRFGILKDTIGHSKYSSI
jgi:hypothetical protein